MNHGFTSTLKKTLYTLYIIPVLFTLNCSSTLKNSKETHSHLGQKVVASALYFKEIKNPPHYLVNSTYYYFDCSGFVMASWDKGGIEVLRNMHYEKGNNAVTTIYKHLQSKGKIFTDPKRAKPGDIIFFHNTYDKNKNRKNDDLLTHVGLIISINKDNTIVFLSKTSRGITEDRMNLDNPMITKRYDEVLNTYMRKKKAGDAPGTKYLTGELFAYFGTY